MRAPSWLSQTTLWLVHTAPSSAQYVSIIHTNYRTWGKQLSIAGRKRPRWLGREIVHHSQERSCGWWRLKCCPSDALMSSHQRPQAVKSCSPHGSCKDPLLKMHKCTKCTSYSDKNFLLSFPIISSDPKLLSFSMTTQVNVHIMSNSEAVCNSMLFQWKQESDSINLFFFFPWISHHNAVSMPK